jgi:hypothetical protein
MQNNLFQKNCIIAFLNKVKIMLIFLRNDQQWNDGMNEINNDCGAEYNQDEQQENAFSNRLEAIENNYVMHLIRI